MNLTVALSYGGLLMIGSSVLILLMEAIKNTIIEINPPRIRPLTGEVDTPSSPEKPKGLDIIYQAFSKILSAFAEAILAATRYIFKPSTPVNIKIAGVLLYSGMLFLFLGLIFTYLPTITSSGDTTATPTAVDTITATATP